MTDKSPELCAKSYNPYTYCPLVFKHEDDFILSKIGMFAQEIKRVNNLKNWQSLSGEEAGLFDRYCGEITAYMNGRIHELVKRLKEKGEIYEASI